MLFILLAAAGILAVLALILILRTLRFVPQPVPTNNAVPVDVDTDLAVSHLQAMVRCRTISQEPMRDEAEFEKFRSLLPEFYPLLFSKAEVHHVGPTGILIHLRGKSGEKPTVMLSHYDVVPVDEAHWDKPPFDAVIEDGVMWGRGTLDMKNQLCCMLEAIEGLLRKDFIPERDLWFALSGEEEVMGPSAPAMRDFLKERGIHPGFVLDEGGDIMDSFFPGVELPCAMIGIGEKGSANFHFIAKGPGGHSSVPQKDNPLVRLCRDMQILEKHPWPMHPGRALELMVDSMGRYCSFSTRLLLANRGFLRPLYYRWLKKQGGMLEAGARTTFALTMARGSTTGNVIPPEAEMFANLRLLEGDTRESALRRIRGYIGNDIEIHENVGSDPCAASLMTCGFEEIRASIAETWPDVVITPYQMVACTDSRHWREICDNVYRFSGKQVTGAEKATVHGNNERIRLENTTNAIRFFTRLMQRC